MNHSFMSTRLTVAAMAALLMAGCASGPTGQTLWNGVVKSEASAVAGVKPWTDHYADSFQAMAQMSAQPRVVALRDHFGQMLVYSRAMDAGKITADEFHLLRTREEVALNQRVANDPPMVAILPGETQGPSVGAILGAAGLGAALGYSSAYRPPQQVICTTGRPIGNTVQTICR